MDRYRDARLLILRVGFGASFFWYRGFPKLVGGVLFAAGVLCRPTCVAMLGVMTMATIEQFGREMPQPAHALKNAFIFAGRPPHRAKPGGEFPPGVLCRTNVINRVDAA